MRIIAVGMMKDEQDIAGWCVRNLFNQGVDDVYVLDNNSSDETAHVVEHEGGEVVPDPEVAYHQARKLTRLMQEHARPGDWVVPFDADEIWQARDGTLRDVIESTPSSANALRGMMIDHVNVIAPVDKYAINVISEMPFTRATSTGYPKVAFRYEDGAQLEQGNHGVVGMSVIFSSQTVDVHHFQYRGYDHFLRKMIQGAAAYDSPDIPADWGTHWRSAGGVYKIGGEDAMRELYAREHVVDIADTVHRPVYIPLNP